MLNLLTLPARLNPTYLFRPWNVATGTALSTLPVNDPCPLPTKTSSLHRTQTPSLATFWSRVTGLPGRRVLSNPTERRSNPAIASGTIDPTSSRWQTMLEAAFSLPVRHLSPQEKRIRSPNPSSSYRKLSPEAPPWKIIAGPRGGRPGRFGHRSLQAWSYFAQEAPTVPGYSNDPIRWLFPKVSRWYWSRTKGLLVHILLCHHLLDPFLPTQCLWCVSLT